mmetsp:Transcript_87338/g.250265  ORF Transcript_87338/g.250265 Transcript_87338/m.250265 type:complete len:246 (-) Transcript_87338:189-926(-)
MVVLPRLPDEEVGEELHGLDGVGAVVDVGLAVVPRKERPLRVPLHAEDRVPLGLDGGGEGAAAEVPVRGQQGEKGGQAHVAGERRGRHTVVVDVAGEVLGRQPTQDPRGQAVRAEKPRAGRLGGELQGQGDAFALEDASLQHRWASCRNDRQSLEAHAGSPEWDVNTGVVGRQRQIEQQGGGVQILPGLRRAIGVAYSDLPAGEEHAVHRVEHPSQLCIAGIVEDGHNTPTGRLDVLGVEGSETR